MGCKTTNLLNRRNVMTEQTFSFPRSSFIGFDHLWEEINKITSGDVGFPKHNVVSDDDGEYFLELALAGYKKEELSLEFKQGLLTISGNPQPRERKYYHKGISSKKFTKTFRLSEHVVVDGADFSDGLLVIKCKLVIPEEMRPRLIDIS